MYIWSFVYQGKLACFDPLNWIPLFHSNTRLCHLILDFWIAQPKSAFSFFQNRYQLQQMYTKDQIIIQTRMQIQHKFHYLFSLIFCLFCLHASGTSEFFNNIVFFTFWYPCWNKVNKSINFHSWAGVYFSTSIHTCGCRVVQQLFIKYLIKNWTLLAYVHMRKLWITIRQMHLSTAH